MASGTISLGSQGYLVAQIVWSSTSNGSTKNTSTVTAKLQIKRSNSYTTTGTWGGSLKVGSTSQSISYYSAVSSSWVTISTNTQTVSHNSDGTGTCYIYGKVTGPSGTSMAGYALSASKTVTLDTIPRASSVSCTSANVGSAATITIARNSKSFTHTLTYTFGDLSGTIATKTSSTSVKWTLPTTFFDEMPNVKSKTGTITCKTYSGSTQVGDAKTCSFTAKVSSASAPTLSPTVKDSNAVTVALTGDSSKLIKYYSNAAFTTGAEEQDGASIKSQKVTCGKKSSTAASGTLSKVENGTFKFTATDSRGYTTTKTLTKTMINYINITCSFKASMTVDGTITIKASGKWFNGSLGSTANALTVLYRYKEHGASSYSANLSDNMTVTKSGNTYEATITISGLDYQKRYTVQVMATDTLRTAHENADPDNFTKYVYASAKTVSCLPVFDWGEAGFNFNVPVTIEGNLLADQVVAKGKSGNWRYIKFASGFAIAHYYGASQDWVMETSWAGGYSIASSIDLALPFDMTLNASFAGIIGTNTIDFRSTYVDKSSINLRPWCPYERTQAASSYRVMVFGFWKDFVAG